MADVIVQEESKEMSKLLKEMYGKDLTDLEFKTLVYMAKKYDLDPVQHEIWAIKYKNRPAMIMTGRDGFLAIAHKSGQFDGMETKALTKDGREVLTCFDPKELGGAVCRVWRKDMSHPIVVAVALHEYNTGQSNWAKMPETMIKKVAESQCLRRAFNISGLYAPEEMDQAFVAKTDTVREKIKEKLFKELPAEKKLEISSAIDGMLERIAEATDSTVEETKEYYLTEWYGKEDIQDMTISQLREFYEKLRTTLNDLSQE